MSYYKSTYIKDRYYEQIALIERENGKKLPDPYYKFKIYSKDLLNGKEFSCRYEDIRSSLMFKFWQVVKEIPEDLKVIKLF